MELEFPLIRISASLEKTQKALKQAASLLGAELYEKGQTIEIKHEGKLQLTEEESQFKINSMASRRYRSPEYYYFFIWVCCAIAFMELIFLNVLFMEDESHKAKEAQVVRYEEKKGNILHFDPGQLNGYVLALFPTTGYIFWLWRRERRQKGAKIEAIAAEIRRSEDPENLTTDSVKATVRLNPEEDGGLSFLSFGLTRPEVILPYLVAALSEVVEEGVEVAYNPEMLHLMQPVSNRRFKGVDLDPMAYKRLTLLAKHEDPFFEEDKL